MAGTDYQELILNAIDALRKRKVRPDLQRICHMVERTLGKDPGFDAVMKKLDQMVDTETVIKVDYKGNTSYRNAATWCKNALSGYQLNSNDATRSILSAIEGVTIEKLISVSSNKNEHATKNENRIARTESKLSPGTQQNAGTNGENEVQTYVGQVEGANLGEIETFFAKLDKETRFKGLYLREALKREVDAKRIYLQSGKYVLAKYVEGNDGDVFDDRVLKRRISNPHLKQKRKRIKKTHGPEWEQESLVKISPWDMVCDYCKLPAKCNKSGDREQLLICKDCSLKVHPSCMKYSKELAERSRSSPWQCIDCKTCHVCNDAGNADTLLFCDSCDKGFHMTCHVPNIDEKPVGSWVCEPCTALDMELWGASEDLDPLSSSGSSNSSVRDVKQDFNQTTKSSSGQVTPDVGSTPNQSVLANLPEQSAQSQQGKLGGASGKSEKTKSKGSHPATWSMTDVASYFANKGFPEEAIVFQDQEIDGSALLLLRRSDVLTALSFKLGPALKLYKLVSELQIFYGNGHGSNAQTAGSSIDASTMKKPKRSRKPKADKTTKPLTNRTGKTMTKEQELLPPKASLKGRRIKLLPSPKVPLSEILTSPREMSNATKMIQTVSLKETTHATTTLKTLQQVDTKSPSPSMKETTSVKTLPGDASSSHRQTSHNDVKSSPIKTSPTVDSPSTSMMESPSDTPHVATVTDR